MVEAGARGPKGQRKGLEPAAVWACLTSLHLWTQRAPECGAFRLESRACGTFPNPTYPVHPQAAGTATEEDPTSSPKAGFFFVPTASFLIQANIHSSWKATSASSTVLFNPFCRGVFLKILVFPG